MKLKNSDFLRNDVLMGLIGKTCHCQEHSNPLEHFKIDESKKEVDVVLTINDIEVPNCGSFLQSYFRQFEHLIKTRVDNSLRTDFKSLKQVIQNLQDKVLDLQDYTESELKNKFGYLKKENNDSLENVQKDTKED